MSEQILHAEKWVQNGFTLCHVPGSGRFVLLHGALPGESVRARVLASRKTHDFAVVSEVLRSSPERLENDCAAFPRCGGCSFRHISYERELALKLELLREWKHLRVCMDLPGFRVFSGPATGYRNQVQVHVRSGVRGFFSPHTNDLVALPPGGCVQLEDDLREAVEAYEFPADGKFHFRLSSDGVHLPEEFEAGKQARQRAGGALWEHPVDGFFQSNGFLLEDWLGVLRASVPENRPATAELFCGSGLIGGVLRDLLGDYTGYELTKRSLASAAGNFRRHNLHGSFLQADLHRQPPDLEGADLVIVNPPRQGLKKRLLEAIARSGARHILYSSCNPHTLNGDLGRLSDEGFRTESFFVFDFFPRTPHLEAVYAGSR